MKKQTQFETTLEKLNVEKISREHLLGIKGGGQKGKPQWCPCGDCTWGGQPICCPCEA